jgi:hypothetical protein
VSPDDPRRLQRTPFDADGFGMRALAVLVATSAIAALIAGCGGNSSAPSLRSSGVTKAEATAYAHYVNLGVADVPGMVSTSLEEEQHERDVVNSGCRLHEIEAHIVDIQSPTFRRGSGLQIKSVRSDVEVLASSELAARKSANEQRVLADARDRACLAGAYTKAFVGALRRGLAARVHLVAGHTTLAVMHPSVPQSIGLRIVVPFTVVGTARSVSASLEVDGLTFTQGPAVVNLLTAGTGGRLSSEQRLLSVLYNRAKA